MNNYYELLTHEYLKIKSSSNNNFESNLFNSFMDEKKIFGLICSNILEFMEKNNIKQNFEIINEKIECFNPNKYEIKKYKERDKTFSSFYNIDIIELNVGDLVKLKITVSPSSKIIIRSSPTILADSGEIYYYMNIGHVSLCEGNAGFSHNGLNIDECLNKSITKFFSNKINLQQDSFVTTFNNMNVFSKLFNDISENIKQNNGLYQNLTEDFFKEGLYTVSELSNHFKEINNFLLITKDFKLFNPQKLDKLDYKILKNTNKNNI